MEVRRQLMSKPSRLAYTCKLNNVEQWLSNVFVATPLEVCAWTCDAPAIRIETRIAKVLFIDETTKRNMHCLT